MADFFKSILTNIIFEYINLGIQLKNKTYTRSLVFFVINTLAFISWPSSYCVLFSSIYLDSTKRNVFIGGLAFCKPMQFFRFTP